MADALNTLFPGRPNYTGPDSGLLGLCHHDRLFEPSRCFSERVEVINRVKPENERATRLRHLICIDPDAVLGIPSEASARWRRIYCGSIGVQFMHMPGNM